MGDPYFILLDYMKLFLKKTKLLPVFIIDMNSGHSAIIKAKENINYNIRMAEYLPKWNQNNPIIKL